MDFSWIKRKQKLPSRDLDDIKTICSILFIDDHAFAVVDNLKVSGWTNTSRIRDAESLDQQEIKHAHILFIDIHGVGRKLKFVNDGLDLIIALKERYPFKKIIAYSSEDHGQVQAFHRGLDVADARLSKNADYYQFTLLVEKFAREAFSLDECVQRIQSVISKEFGQTVNTQYVVRALERLMRRGSYTPGDVSKAFNLQNAVSVAEMVKLFFNI